jgi:hypothetical protein
MPRDTWEENSAFEIGTLCLRLPHPVGRQQAHHEQKHDPRTVSLTLAHQGPMTEGVQLMSEGGNEAVHADDSVVAAPRSAVAGVPR